MRVGTAKTVLRLRGGTPWRGKNPGEHRLTNCLNSRSGVRTSRGEQSLEGGFPHILLCNFQPAGDFAVFGQQNGRSQRFILLGGWSSDCLPGGAVIFGRPLLQGDTKRARPVLCGHFGVHRAIGTSTCTGNARSSERAAHEQGLASSRSRTTHSSEGAGAGRARTNVRTAVSRSSERVTVERRLGASTSETAHSSE